jgi:hypothetical protein
MADALTISRRYFTRSDTTFRPRRKKNEENWEAYLGRQDFSYKADYQSQETTPGFPVAVEHIVGTFERALTDSDDWLTAQPAGVGTPFLPPEIMQNLVQFYGERLWQPGNHPETGYGIQCLVGDACKRGIMEPTVVAKVWPVLVKKRLFRFEGVEPEAESGTFAANELLGKQLKPVDVEQLRIAVELVPYEDYFPDPSPACRYEIHRTRKALHELLANPDYDKAAVRNLIGKANEELSRRNAALTRAEAHVGPDPYVIEVFEAWGDLIDHETGEIAVVDGVRCENVFWTWAGDEILRKPTPNPSWDGTRPFIVSRLIRVPGSIEGKALADHAVPMWRAMNELVNLLLDQATRAAWGVGQVRPDIMESPEEIADGVPQGYSAVLKPNTPQGLKFYERVDNGEAPQVSLENLNRLQGYLQESLATPDTKLGQLPQRATKATEIVQAMQSAGSLYESFAARFEDTFLEPLFEKMWKMILQYADDFLQDELIAILGPSNTLRMLDLSQAERFQLMQATTFKVRGLRGVASKERTFAKLMTVVNLLVSNPQFADNFGEKYDLGKLWDQLLRAVGLDPLTLELDEAPEEPVDPALIAGGQLDPSLAPGSGASQPNVADTSQAQAGGDAGMAAQNPAANLAAGGA